MANHALPWAKFHLGLQPVSNHLLRHTLPKEHEKEPKVRHELKPLLENGGDLLTRAKG